MANFMAELIGRPALNALERDGALGAGFAVSRADPRWRRLAEALTEAGGRRG